MKYEFDPKRLTDLREQLGWSKRHLSKVSKVKRQSIIQYENGEVDPMAKSLGRLATATGTHPGYFFVEINVSIHQDDEQGTTSAA